VIGALRLNEHASTVSFDQRQGGVLDSSWLRLRLDGATVTLAPQRA
jgi:hypothetical protein